MKLILYMAISIDGYITRKDHDISWVCDTDWEHLKQYLRKTDAVIMGRKTMEVSGEDFPYDSN